ncbi:hypothetical protein AVEN_65790-1 [Araneus ventricosus]|uniref:Uncharacterized protein n=1 Tax=Araneus ventricosus TaxID=182803 RepID=A0A4Y2AEX9_ARAVE|nr:hypothetical protein AVEN_65790-1 [Araneus ventricosus]
MDCSDKLIAKSYDGAAAFAGQHTGVPSLIILLQTWKVASQQCESYGWEESVTGSRLPRVYPTRWNFSSRLVNTVFKSGDEVYKVFDKFVQSRLPRVYPTRWNFSSRLVNTVFRNGNELCKVFDEFLQCRLNRVYNTRWNFSSGLVNTVFRNGNELCKVFYAILDDADQTQQENPAPASQWLPPHSRRIFILFLPKGV